MKKHLLSKTDFSEFEKWLLNLMMLNLRTGSVLLTNLQTSFYENFTIEELPAKTERPPLGLKPQIIHSEERFNEIMEAIARYKDAGKLKDVPLVWITEAYGLIDTIKNPL